MSLSSLYIVQFLIKYKERIDDTVKQQTNELVAYNSTKANHQFFPMSLKGSHELLWIQIFIGTWQNIKFNTLNIGLLTGVSTWW